MQPPSYVELVETSRWRVGLAQVQTLQYVREVARETSENLLNPYHDSKYSINSG
jgi:hypothetical protein